MSARGEHLVHADRRFATGGGAVARILAINAVSFAGLLILHRIGVAAALLRPAPVPTHASA